MISQSFPPKPNANTSIPLCYAMLSLLLLQHHLESEFSNLLFSFPYLPPPPWPISHQTSSHILILHLDNPPPPEERNPVLDPVDDVADRGQDDEEEDDDDGDDDVAFDHGGWFEVEDGGAVEVAIWRSGRGCDVEVVEVAIEEWSR